VAVDPSAVVVDASSPGDVSSPGGLEESSPETTLDPPLLVGDPPPEEWPDPPELCEAPLEPPWPDGVDWKEVPGLEPEQARMPSHARAVRGGVPGPGVPVLLMSSNAAAEPLTDDEATALQRALARYEPKDVHDALDRIDEQTLRGCQASLNASGPLVGGASETGVFVHKLEGGRAAIRVAYTDINGAIYDDLELAASAVKRLVETLIAMLDAKRAPHAR